MAASRTKTFRNQNHRFQSKFAYCKLFGVYAGVFMVNNLVFRWPKPLFFMVLGAHGIYTLPETITASKST